MSELGEMARHYNEIRDRLMNPPNAVRDLGIDLKRKLIPPEKPVDNQEDTVLENHLVAKVTIKELFTSKPLKMKMILDVVCNHFKVTHAEVKGGSRTNSYVRPRHIFCYLAVRHAGMSFPMVGKFLGGRDHTTILHAVRSMKERMVVDNELRKSIEDIEEILCIEDGN